jgi:hypothetical protein
MFTEYSIDQDLHTGLAGEEAAVPACVLNVG